MNNYVHQVKRVQGLAKEVTANANGVYLTFIKGKDGRPLEVSRHMSYPVYYPGALYVRNDTYRGIIRQVAAVLSDSKNKKSTTCSGQLGFEFPKED